MRIYFELEGGVEFLESSFYRADGFVDFSESFFVFFISNLGMVVYSVGYVFEFGLVKGLGSWLCGLYISVDWVWIGIEMCEWDDWAWVFGWDFEGVGNFDFWGIIVLL